MERQYWLWKCELRVEAGMIGGVCYRGGGNLVVVVLKSVWLGGHWDY